MELLGHSENWTAILIPAGKWARQRTADGGKLTWGETYGPSNDPRVVTNAVNYPQEARVHLMARSPSAEAYMAILPKDRLRPFYASVVACPGGDIVMIRAATELQSEGSYAILLFLTSWERLLKEDTQAQQ